MNLNQIQETSLTELDAINTGGPGDFSFIRLQAQVSLILKIYTLVTLYRLSVFIFRIPCNLFENFFFYFATFHLQKHLNLLN